MSPHLLSGLGRRETIHPLFEELDGRGEGTTFDEQMSRLDANPETRTSSGSGVTGPPLPRIHKDKTFGRAVESMESYKA